jgi:hypothetical protein
VRRGELERKGDLRRMAPLCQTMGKGCSWVYLPFCSLWSSVYCCASEIGHVGRYPRSNFSNSRGASSSSRKDAVVHADLNIKVSKALDLQQIMRRVGLCGGLRRACRGRTMCPCRPFSGSHVFDESSSNVFRLNCPGDPAVPPLRE